MSSCGTSEIVSRGKCQNGKQRSRCRADSSANKAIVYGVYAYVSSFIFVRIFKPYEDEIRKREGYAAEAEGRNKEKEDNREIVENE